MSCTIRPAGCEPGVSGSGVIHLESIMINTKSLLIGGLIVAVGILGYLYYDNQRNTVQIKLPAVKIEKQ